MLNVPRSLPVLIPIFRYLQHGMLHHRFNMKFPASDYENLITTVDLKAAS